MTAPPVLRALQVITLQQAALRWHLRPDDVMDLASQLYSKERRLADGRIGFYVSDIEAVLGPPQAPSTAHGVRITTTLAETAMSHDVPLEQLQEQVAHLSPWWPRHCAPRYRVVDLEDVLGMVIERVEVYSLALTAAVLAVSRRQASKLVGEGWLSGVRSGNRVFIPRASLEAEIVRRARGVPFAKQRVSRPILSRR